MASPLKNDSHLLLLPLEAVIPPDHAMDFCEFFLVNPCGGTLICYADVNA